MDSIEAQTFSAWRLLARDDGSDDDTAALLKLWAERDGRVTVVENDGNRPRSVLGNFTALLDLAERSDGEVFLFCDQDDIWEPEKIEVCMQAFDDASTSGPRLLVSDLRLVDAGAAEDLGSFWSANMMPPAERRTVAELCSRNLYPGCSMAFNRELLMLASDVPKAAIVHDWWLAILACATSDVIEVSQPLVRYRQHHGNATGATSWWRELKHLLVGSGHQSELFRQSFAQAEAAADRLRARGYREAADSVTEYRSLAGMSPRAALKKMLDLRLRRSHPALFLAFALRLLLMRRQRSSMVEAA
jgi:glycosyltransferase involved in cell wall biosynthesis